MNERYSKTLSEHSGEMSLTEPQQSRNITQSNCILVVFSNVYLHRSSEGISVIHSVFFHSLDCLMIVVTKDPHYICDKTAGQNMTSRFLCIGSYSILRYAALDAVFFFVLLRYNISRSPFHFREVYHFESLSKTV